MVTIYREETKASKPSLTTLTIDEMEQQWLEAICESLPEGVEIELVSPLSGQTCYLCGGTTPEEETVVMALVAAKW